MTVGTRSVLFGVHLYPSDNRWNRLVEVVWTASRSAVMDRILSP
jgi:hypothetical protein